MARQIRINRAKRKKQAPQDLAFTVIYLPLNQGNGTTAGRRESGERGTSPGKYPEAITGYQVTVPLLPGLVTFGRTLEEAQEMARDAIECHIAGLKKSGEPIPNERLAHKGKLRVALSA
jgi:predicted RNase H-like HicB family nuclease